MVALDGSTCKYSIVIVKVVQQVLSLVLVDCGIYTRLDSREINHLKISIF